MINTIKNPILITIIAALLHCVWTETGACRSLDDVYVPLACARGKCTGENRRHLRPLAMGERPSTAIMTMTPELAAFWREIKGKAQEIATLIRDAVHEPVDAVRATCSYIAEHPGDADILMQQIKVAVANVDAWDQFAAGVVFEQQRNEYLQKQLNRSTVEGQEIPDFIFSINQNLQAMFAEGLPGEAHTDCGISSAVVALFLENRFGADVAIERYRGGCKYARAGTTNHHIWLVVTDTRTGVKYYVSVSDGQFADPPAGISVPRLYLFAGRKEPVLIDKTGYRQWYYSEEGPTHATVARLSARPLAEALEAGPGMIDGKKIENEVVAELDVIRLRAVLGLMPKYFPSLVLPVLLDTVRNNEVASNV